MQLAFKALVDYDVEEVADCPHPSYALPFKKNDYLHMKQVDVCRGVRIRVHYPLRSLQKYNDDWWIGRVVGECETIGFLPR